MTTRLESLELSLGHEGAHHLHHSASAHGVHDAHGMLAASRAPLAAHHLHGSMFGSAVTVTGATSNLAATSNPAPPRPYAKADEPPLT